MTIYELLERMLIGPRLRADEEQAAVEMIRELRDLNALGTLAAQEKQTHVCEPLAPSYTWHGRSGTGRPTLNTTRCRICGEEMP